MHRIRIRLVSALAALAAALGLAVFPAGPAAASEHDPVILVHGWLGADWNWTAYRSWFASDGWSRVYVFGYDWGQSNVTTAYQLRDKVNQVLAETGASKVDIVSHSMGGLSSRYYVKHLGGQSKVDDWVSIGGPNHGTNAAYACWTTSCGEMRYNSWLLNDLNSGDETPGPVHYGTFRSWCDEVINPDSSVILSGATNREVGCIGHVSLLGSWSTYAGVRDFVRW